MFIAGSGYGRSWIGLPNNLLLPIPLNDLLPKCLLWNQLNSVNTIIIGLPHAHTELDPGNPIPSLRARNPPAYRAITKGRLIPLQLAQKQS